jgi:radical SAM protein with 4Fe4S-binding SPASM domain
MFDPKTRFKLFKLNKHFCSAPWNLLYVHVDGTVKPCTRSKNPIGDLNHTSIQDILINNEYIKLRKDILEDKVTDNCKRCLGFENTVEIGKFESLRNHYNTQCMYSSVDHIDPTQFKLVTVDLHWSSVCDLKCVTCWHGQSSSIAREQGMPVLHTPTEVANNVIEYITSNQSEIKEIYLSGGEPTLIKYNAKLLQQIDKREDLLIRVNTNMQWDQDNAIIQEILKFPNVLFTCSVDGIGEKFDYIRRGGSWQKCLDNLNFLKNQHVKLRANTVFFVLTAQELPSIINFFMEEMDAMDHTINQISMGQDKLRCRNLPKNIKEKVLTGLEESLEKYKDNLNISGCLKNCLLELENPIEDDYREYFDGIDKLQGSNWRSLYPELV